MQTVLVLRAAGLGDLLVAVPALRALRRRFPEHHVVLAAPAALGPLAQRCGAVDEILPTSGPDALVWPGPRPPDVAVNLHGVGPQSHRALDATRPRQRIGLRAAGWAGPDWADVARAHGHERERWCAVVEAFGVRADPMDLALPRPPAAAADHVVVHPGAAYGAKRWPPERFAAVAAELARGGRRIVVTGSPAERSLADEVAALAALPRSCVVAGRTDIGQLTDIVGRAALVVCGDTGVAHLATALGTPSVVLFGPEPPDRWGPPSGGAHVVLTDGGRRRGDPFADTPDPALLAVGVDEVVGVAGALLARQGAHDAALRGARLTPP
jgi:ADP-heptose:LPS heptosyltransferase